MRILALMDALGTCVRFVLLSRQRFDRVVVLPLVDGVSFGTVIAGRAFDSNAIVARSI